MTPPAAPSSPPSSARRGLFYIIAGTLLLTSQDAISKWLTDDYHFGEIFFYRGLWAYLPILLIARHSGGLHLLRSRRPRASLLRAGLNTAAGIAIITSLSLLPIADVFAVVFVSPLIITALSPWLLSEHVGWRRWSAVVVGFAGVLLMTRPGGAGMNVLVLLPLLVALLMALRDIVTRRLRIGDSPVSVLFVSVTLSVLVGALTLPFGTTFPPLEDWPFFAVAGLINGSAHFLIIRAFQLAEAASVAPFRYLSLVWVVFIGFIVWGDVPDIWVVAGAALVVGSGFYTFRRETRRHKTV